ncbi:gamma-glutamyltransferase [Bacillus sp. FJAT-42376]|uniref:gamma-glutamyltransferase n=1 Tax=Bacillus sp. FJAT-42376 TaxID=2014076 RepID=UPI000F4D5612|nr:gamma-glutamyltransferase [Bacillus sp. FJAT-42376]AZB44351.1 gamma-glutamyltransferase [Bacillus sp. FJAT-42376]
MRKKRLWTALAILLIVLLLVAQSGILNRPSEGEAAVAANHPLAVKAGMKVLNSGGNAMDAAVAVSYALGVTEPFGSGPGGGGMMVVYNPKKNIKRVYDYKDAAPVNGEGSKDQIAVPGFVKGLERAHRDMGNMKMSKLLEPAIQYAGKGYKADEFLSERLKGAEKQFEGTLPESFYPDGNPVKRNEIIKQPELADTLRSIQKQGSKGFYSGEMGKSLAKELDSVSADDLKNYKVKEEKPLEGQFGGYKVMTSPPSAGGISLLQILKLADLYKSEFKSGEVTDSTHLLGEFTKHAYHERITEIQDPSFGKVDTERLLSKKHLRNMADEMDFDKASFDIKVNNSEADEEDHDNTTHFVIKDKEGTIISVTNTLGEFFGSKKQVNGVFMNNSLSNFSEDPESANRMEPGKRPNNYTAPSILESDKEIVGIGTPGGKRIPTVLAQVLVQREYFGASWQEAINERRFYIENHQITMEPGYPKNVRKRLEKRGYDVRVKKSPFYYGGVMALSIDKKSSQVSGAADPRRTGTWSSSN